MIRSLTTALLLTTAAPLLADVPKVATDIAPVHGLVARVMEGVGSPTLIIDPSASPHHYAMRPSEARALQEADIVIWVGEELTPWFEDRIATLAHDAVSLDLIHAPDTVLLDVREETIFADHDDHNHEEEDHDHGDHEDEHDDHGDEHDDHGDEHDDHGDEHDDHGDEHDDAHGQDGDHAEEHDDHGDEHGDDHADAHDHDDHHHEGTDPHAWLSIENARVWTREIAETLSGADPENAGTYDKNAEAAIAELTAVEAEIESALSALDGKRFIVFHDAYQYLEAGFDLPAAAALSASDATDPGPAHIRALQDLIAAQNVGCAFAEPQFNTRRLEAVLEGTEVTIGTLDPIGRDIDQGPGFYPTLMRNLGASMVACLKK